MKSFEILLQNNNGIIIRGPSKSGKSELVNSFVKSYTRIYINSFTKDEIYGSYSKNTNEWKDGLIPKIVKEINNKEIQYIIFDGEINSELVESFNSVLDINKILTLPTGEHLSMKKVKFIFEVTNFDYLSLATISRCGIITLTDESKTLFKIYYSILSKSKDSKDLSFLSELFPIYILPSIKYVLKLKSKVKHTEKSLLYSLLHYLTSFKMNSQEMNYFIYLLYWSLTDHLSNTKKEMYEKFLREELNVAIPSQFSKMIFSNETNNWMKVENCNEEIYQKINLFNIIKNEYFILCSGTSGSGKKSLIKALESSQTIEYSLSYTTTITDFIKYLECYTKYVKYGSTTIMTSKTLNKNLYVLLNEFTTPKLDNTNTSIFESFFKQIIETKSFIHPISFKTIKIELINFLAFDSEKYCKISQNFLSNIHLFHFNKPSNENLLKRSRELLKQQFPNHIYPNIQVNKIVEVMVSFYNYSSKINEDITPKYISKWIKLFIHLFDTNIMYSEEQIYFYCFIVGYEVFLFSQKNEERTKYYDFYFSLWIKSGILKNSAESFSSLVQKIDYHYLHPIQKLFSENNVESYRKKSNSKFQVFDQYKPELLYIYMLLNSENSNIIIYGSNYIGKKTMIKYIGSVLEYNIIELTYNELYSNEIFMNQVVMIISAVMKNENVIFLVENSEIIPIEYIDKINILISTGGIYGIVDSNQHEKIKSLISSEIEMEEDEFIKERIKSNLHVILTNSKNQEKSKIQSKYNIVGLDDWNISTYKEYTLYHFEILTNRLHEESEMKTYYINSDRDYHCNLFVELFIESSVIIKNNSPYLYQYYIYYYIMLYRNQSNALYNDYVRLEKGLSILDSVQSEIENLQKICLEKQEHLLIKRRNSTIKLQEILEQQKTAESEKKISIELERSISKQKEEIEEKKKAVIEKLHNVEKIVEKSKESVQLIQRQHLEEIKSMKRPPQNIQLTLEMIGIMFKEEYKEWKNILKLISSMDFISKILSFNNEMITNEMVQTIKKDYLSQSEFTSENVYHSSRACGPIFDWITGQIEYANIKSQLKPIQEEMRRIENEVKECETKYNTCQNTIIKLSIEVEETQKSYSILLQEQNNIENEIVEYQNKINSAKNLLNSLNKETERWFNNKNKYMKEYKNLNMICLYQSLSLVFLSNNNVKHEKELENLWNKYIININKNEALMKLRSTNSYNDISPYQNIVLNNLPPLCIIIDPLSISKNYLYKVYNQIVEYDKIPIQKLVNILSIQLPLSCTILYNVSESIDKIFSSLLHVDILNLSLHQLPISTQLIDKRIVYNNDNRLFIYSKAKIIGNISYYIYTVNLSLSKININYQIQSNLMSKYLPILYNQFTTTNIEIEKYRNEIINSENVLLSSLIENDGEILKNEIIINSLTSIEINVIEQKNHLSKSEEITKSLNEYISNYEPIINTLSLIYKLLLSYSKISSYYNFSIRHFLSIILNLNIKIDPQYTIENMIVFIKIIYSFYNLSFGMENKYLFFLNITKIFINRVHKLEIQELFELFFSLNSSNIDSRSIPLNLKNYYDSLKIKQQNNLFNLLVNEKYNKYFTPEYISFLNRVDYVSNIDIKSINIPINNPNAIFLKIFFCLSLLCLYTDQYEDIFQLLSLSVYGTNIFCVCYEVPSYIYLCNSTDENFPLFYCTNTNNVLIESIKSFTSKIKVIPLGVEESRNEILETIENGSDVKYLILENLHLDKEYILENLEKYREINKAIQIITTFPNKTQINIKGDYLLYYDYSIYSFNRYFELCISLYPHNKYSMPTHLYIICIYIYAVIVLRNQYNPIGFIESYNFSFQDLSLSLSLCNNIYTISKANVFQTLRTLFMQVIYGNHIYNKKDKDILNIIIDHYLNESQNLADYNLYLLSDNKLVVNFVNITVNDFIQFLSNLRNITTIQLIGLPASTSELNSHKILNEISKQVNKMSEFDSNWTESLPEIAESKTREYFILSDLLSKYKNNKSDSEKRPKEWNIGDANIDRNELSLQEYCRYITNKFVNYNRWMKNKNVVNIFYLSFPNYIIKQNKK